MEAIPDSYFVLDIALSIFVSKTAIIFEVDTVLICGSRVAQGSTRIRLACDKSNALGIDKDVILGTLHQPIAGADVYVVLAHLDQSCTRHPLCFLAVTLGPVGHIGDAVVLTCRCCSGALSRRQISLDNSLFMEGCYMINQHEIHVDLLQRGCDPIIQLSQGDVGSHEILFRITKNRRRWRPPAGLSVLVHYSNSFHSGGTYDTLPDGSAAWKLGRDCLRIALVPEMMALPGSVHVVVTLLHGDKALSAFHVQLMVRGLATATSPVLANYSNITGFLPKPDTAEEGQFFTAETVTDTGKVTSVAAVAGPSGGEIDSSLLPTAAVTQANGIATITMTDKNGTTTVTVSDGNDGKSAYEYAREGGYAGTEEAFAAKLAAEGYGYVAQPEAPEDTNLLWLDTDDSRDGSAVLSNWNAAAGEPGHILNRTHYEYVGKVVEEVTINAASFDTVITAAHPIVVGETYTVHWGEDTYICEAWDGSVINPAAAGMPGLGDYGAMMDGPVTGEPFLIAFTGNAGQVIGFGEDMEISFSIDGSVAVKIPDKYLPDTMKYALLEITEEEFASANNGNEYTIRLNRNISHYVSIFENGGTVFVKIPFDEGISISPVVCCVKLQSGMVSAFFVRAYSGITVREYLISTAVE